MQENSLFFNLSFFLYVKQRFDTDEENNTESNNKVIFFSLVIFVVQLAEIVVLFQTPYIPYTQIKFCLLYKFNKTFIPSISVSKTLLLSKHGSNTAFQNQTNRKFFPRCHDDHKCDVDYIAF